MIQRLRLRSFTANEPYPTLLTTGVGAPGPSDDPSDDCTATPADCVQEVGTSLTAIFKNIGNGKCCSSLGGIVVSTQNPDETVVANFCSSCNGTATKSGSLNDLYGTLCSD